MGGVWNVLTVEQLRQLSDEQVAQRANERLVPLGAPVQGMWIQPADFMAAQYYVNELERRERRRADDARDDLERKRWYVDFIVEALIVILILVEIGLSIWDHNQYTQNAKAELAVFNGMQTVLGNLRDSSQATADTMKAERKVMEGMKTSLDRQVALFYDVQLSVIYNEGTKRLALVNAGRSNVSLYEARFNDSETDVKKFAKPQLIVPSGTQEFPLEKQVETLSKEIPKDQQRTFTFEFLVKNERQEEFTLSGDLIALWHGDVLWFATQPSTIVAGWSK